MSFSWHRNCKVQCSIGCHAPTKAEYLEAQAHDACRKIIKQSFFGGDVWK